MAKNKNISPASNSLSSAPAAQKLDGKLLARLHQLITDHAVIWGKDELLLSRKGVKGRWLLDIRAVFLMPEALDIIAGFFCDLYASQCPLQIGGMEVGAVPLVSAILMKAQQRGLKINGLIMRKERKNEGRSNDLEGTLTTDPIILVDDSINSGSSLEKCRVILEREGHVVKQAFLVVDFLGKVGQQWRADNNISIQSVFNLIDFGLTFKGGVRLNQSPIAETYAPAWHAVVKGANPFHVVPKSAPIFHNNRIYYGSDKAVYSCFDAANGKLIWQYQCTGTNTKGLFSSAALHNGRIYFGAYNGNIYCLDAETGAEIWNHQVSDWVGSSPLIIPKYNMMFIGLEYARPRTEGSVAAFYLDTGARQWESWLKTYQHGSAAYSEKHDLVIFGTNDHTVSAYRPLNGEKAWETTVRAPIKQAPVVDDTRNLTIAAGHDGGIHFFNTATGKKIAEVTTDNLCYTTPLIHQNRLYCGSTDKNLYVIDLDTLTLVKKIDCHSRIMSSPRLIPPGNIIFGTTKGQVLELDPATLTFNGRTQIPDCITNAIAFSPDGTRMFIPTYMNELYAFARKVWPNPDLQAAKEQDAEEVVTPEGLAETASANE